jgi:hypothetical protein
MLQAGRHAQQIVTDRRRGALKIKNACDAAHMLIPSPDVVKHSVRGSRYKGVSPKLILTVPAGMVSDARRLEHTRNGYNL